MATDNRTRRTSSVKPFSDASAAFALGALVSAEVQLDAARKAHDAAMLELQDALQVLRKLKGVDWQAIEQVCGLEDPKGYVSRLSREQRAARA
ncbi:MAG: hypothetical protein QM765_21030 [Myxococcales bacterium]